MKTYIALLNWTQKGIQEFKESPSRLEKAKLLIARNGGEIKSFFMTLGRYDMVAVIEAPDDAIYARVMLALAQKGGVRTESLTAFTEEEYSNIIETAN
jgi:uncharacterized protein with GYD domain